MGGFVLILVTCSLSRACRRQAFEAPVPSTLVTTRSILDSSPLFGKPFSGPTFGSARILAMERGAAPLRRHRLQGSPGAGLDFAAEDPGAERYLVTRSS
jgi:hypothetical protein